jgi:hypothetical protein
LRRGGPSAAAAPTERAEADIIDVPPEPHAPIQAASHRGGRATARSRGGAATEPCAPRGQVPWQTK